MRLDKYLTSTNTATRKEAASAARGGEITVNGAVVRDASVHIDESNDVVTYRGVTVEYRRFTYIMLNKPEGYVSATEDKSAPYVIELLPEKYRKNMFPCGRLDKYTTGLMMLTDDGALSHYLLSPKHHAQKVYVFTCEAPLERIDELERGVYIDGGYLTKPCKVEKLTEKEGRITLTEGKYHQIKQMLRAVGNRVLTLERVAFAGIELDRSLERGEWRFLTENEVALLKKHTNKPDL